MKFDFSLFLLSIKNISSPRQINLKLILWNQKIIREYNVYIIDWTWTLTKNSVNFYSSFFFTFKSFLEAFPTRWHYIAILSNEWVLLNSINNSFETITIDSDTKPLLMKPHIFHQNCLKVKIIFIALDSIGSPLGKPLPNSPIPNSSNAMKRIFPFKQFW